MNVEELLDNFNLQGYQNLIAEDSETSTFNQDTDFRINAFQVTAFFVFPEFMDRSVDLLEAAFRLFPGRTYCIVSLPFISQQHPLLDSFNAIRMNPNCISSEGLYIADRSAFFDPLLARIASPEDLQRVTNLFPDSERVFDNCNSERNETLQTVVMYNGIDGNIVGCAVIDNTVDLTMLRRQFHVDKLVRTSQHPSNRCGLVKKFHLMPQYISSANNILMVSDNVQDDVCNDDDEWCLTILCHIKHVMHISQKTMLLYGTQSESSINPVLDRHLIHLDPKRPIQIPSAVSKASTTPDSDKGAFQQLYATTVRYLSEPKTEVNHRIVVVGGSKTGLSFIHTLISVPYLYFNNITLLTLDKEEHIDEMEDDIGMEMMESFAEDDEYLERRDLDTVSRRPNISVIGGRLRDFDRQQKIAITYSNAEIHFDMLVLATSRPYRVPSSLKNSEAPVDGIIDLDKSHLCLEAISRHVGNDNRLSQIVVYGSSLDAFCTVNMLIAGLRVNPERIMLISPNGKLSALGDDVLEEKVNAVLDALDVKHYNHYSIDNFEYNDEGQLCNVWFSNTPYIEEQRERLQKEAEHAGTDENGAADRRQKLLEEMKNINKEVFDVNCHLLINCQYQDVDPGLLEAIHHQALVFDGRLIVDPEFKTTDSDIFAAGPLAKFSRRYGPSDHMENFNTWEVGQKMARSVMQSLGIEPSDNSEFELPAVDNMGEGHSAKNDKASLPEKRLPTFQNTVTRRCVLPGRNHFLQIRLPSHNPGKCRVIRTAHPPLEVINSSEDSKKLVVSHRQRYTCIMVNRVTGIIENVTYYGKEPIEEHNLRSIVGLPASYCNDMVGRFDEGLVECFVDFLRQHWAMALFCDRFSQFRERLLRQIEDVEDVVKFAEQLLHIVTKKEPTVPSAATGGDIGASSQGLLLAHERLTSTTRQYIERELLKFIHEYQEELGEIPSVYHIPTFK